jgi:hypothetical protein
MSLTELPARQAHARGRTAEGLTGGGRRARSSDHSEEDGCGSIAEFNPQSAIRNLL